jgi:hypothetical protein
MRSSRKKSSASQRESIVRPNVQAHRSGIITRLAVEDGLAATEVGALFYLSLAVTRGGRLEPERHVLQPDDSRPYTLDDLVHRPRRG